MLAHAALIGFRALEAYSFVDNPASARVLVKAGFVDLGVVRRAYPERGGLRRVRRFELRLPRERAAEAP
jgi:RimJ/RimL family protein N-acetyltransferase